jgi:hypothetical protein
MARAARREEHEIVDNLTTDFDRLVLAASYYQLLTDEEHRRRASIPTYRPPPGRSQKPTPKPQTAAQPHRFALRKTLIDSGRPPVSAVFPPAESIRIAPPPKRHPAHAQPRSSKPPSPHTQQKRYGAVQYSACQTQFQYPVGIKNRAQKYWTLHFAAAYKSVP